MGRGVIARRILHLLVLAGLVLAPFGRIGLAQAHALAMPHGAPAAMAGHCPDAPTPAPERDNSERIDCMTACSAMAPAAGLDLARPPACATAAAAAGAFTLNGIRPGADPPPPRAS
jgi:hypothetical protein